VTVKNIYSNHFSSPAFMC